MSGVIALIGSLSPGGFAVLHVTTDIAEDELAAGRFTVEVPGGANNWEIHA